MRIVLSCTLLSTALLLNGCAINPEDCDPRNRDASIITKAQCSTSGNYQSRLDQKQQILLDEQKTNQMFRDVYAAVEKEKSEVKTELRNQKTEYSALQKALNTLLTEIRSKAQGNQTVEKEIAELEQQLQTITTQNDPAVMQKQQQLDELRDKAMQLEQSLGLR